MSPANLYRFDELQFAEPFVKGGILSFGPAASYNDSMLSAAQQDDELRRKVAPKVPGHQLFVGNPGGGQANVIQNLLSVSLTYDIKLDGKYLCYYTLCCALQNDPKFYAEFPKSNCLVTIHDVAAFEARMATAIAVTYPDWQGRSGEVEYFDAQAVYAPGSIADLVFAKNDTYSWQTEFRYVLIAPPDKAPKGRVPLVLGSLEDICTITPK